MIPVDQSRLHDPENGVCGDCHSACIASILGLPIEALDQFHENYTAWGMSFEAEKVDWEAHAAATNALIEIGYIPVSIDMNTPARPGRAPKGYSIANGPSDRGCDHSCVALDGVIVFDPHPSRSGLVRIADYEVLVPVVGEPS